jgi:hypothetical protein
VALKEAVKIKRANPDTLITVISMAPQKEKQLLKTLFYYEVDRIIHLSDAVFAGSDVYATAFALSNAIKVFVGDFNIILGGDYSLDGLTGQLGGELASSVKIEKNYIINFDSSIQSSNNPLSKANVVVGIGRGINAILIHKVKEFASYIGAEVCCTRPVRDSGLVDAERIVGDTGISINPNLYIALGISGAIQHLEAVNAKLIISFNADPNAPIFAKSDVAINQKIEDVIDDLLSWAKNFSM